MFKKLSNIELKGAKTPHCVIIVTSSNFGMSFKSYHSNKKNVLYSSLFHEKIALSFVLRVNFEQQEARKSTIDPLMRCH